MTKGYFSDWAGVYTLRATCAGRKAWVTEFRERFTEAKSSSTPPSALSPSAHCLQDTPVVKTESKNSYLFPLNGSSKLIQDCGSVKLSCHTFRRMKYNHLLRSTGFHFLWFYNIVSSTDRFQTSALEENIQHKQPPASKTRLMFPGKQPSETNPECSRDFSVNILAGEVCLLMCLVWPHDQITCRKYLGLLFSCGLAWGNPTWSSLLGTDGDFWHTSIAEQCQLQGHNVVADCRCWFNELCP